MRGKFLVLEGVDGSGKTTQCLALADELTRRYGIEVVLTREPSTGPIGALARQETCRFARYFLFQADRTKTCEDVILPALERGAWVIADRYAMSTLVYQGHELREAVAPPHVWAGNAPRLHTLLTENLRFAVKPDLTLVLTAPLEVINERIARRGPRSSWESVERLAEYHRRYETVMSEHRRGSMGPIVAIDACGSKADITQELLRAITTKLEHPCAPATPQTT